MALDDEAEIAFRNIHRSMEMYDLDSHILSVKLRTADRFFFEAHLSMSIALSHLSARGLFQEAPASGGPHNLAYQLWSGFWGQRRSYRALERPSLQITLTELKDKSRRLVGDADIDLGNPIMDLLGFFTHLVEVIVPGKTSHRKLEPIISKRYDAWTARQSQKERNV